MRRQLYYARRLGRYRLKVRIGHGGTSEVWLAWDDALRRDVALKILDRSVSGQSTAIARFEREAMAASGLQSPHTIRVFDFGASDDGVWFMAMEHLEGVDLATLVDEVGALPAPRAVRFARQACAALSEAHDAGVVHRDVKPDNLFVCRMGDEPDFLKMLDFGIAKIEGAEEDATVTRAGWVHGTPAYMSPEVCNGLRADARSDVYSLGAVLYFLLTGTPPFTAATAAAVMVAHVKDVPDKPSARAPVPADVERIVLRALEKEPESRFQSARELDAALAACKDAVGWTNDQAHAFWTTFDQKPRSGIAARPVVDDDAATMARPSVSRGMKAG
jgi:serine/threonine protein kinase